MKVPEIKREIEQKCREYNKNTGLTQERFCEQYGIYPFIWQSLVAKDSSSKLDAAILNWMNETVQPEFRNTWECFNTKEKKKFSKEIGSSYSSIRRALSPKEYSPKGDKSILNWWWGCKTPTNSSYPNSPKEKYIESIPTTPVSGHRRSGTPPPSPQRFPTSPESPPKPKPKKLLFGRCFSDDEEACAKVQNFEGKGKELLKDTRCAEPKGETSCTYNFCGACCRIYCFATGWDCGSADHKQSAVRLRVDDMLAHLAAEVLSPPKKTPDIRRRQLHDLIVNKRIELFKTINKIEVLPLFNSVRKNTIEAGLRIGAGRLEIVDFRKAEWMKHPLFQAFSRKFVKEAGWERNNCIYALFVILPDKVVKTLGWGVKYLAYVGRTKQKLSNRWRAHLRGKNYLSDLILQLVNVRVSSMLTILEECTEKKLTEKERTWIDAFNGETRKHSGTYMLNVA